jgi:alkaline phosphatase
MKKKRVFLLVLATVLVISVVAVVFVSPKKSETENVILLIGDGMGPAQVLVARYYSEGLDGKLKMETMPQVGLMSHHYNGFLWDKNDLDHDGVKEEVIWGAGDYDGDGIPDRENLVTDSAAAGTALATGQKTYRGSINYDNEGNPIENIGDYAKKLGKSVGIVATSRITHATPAVFGAHNEHRDNENEIAREYIYETQPAILLGGGKRHFDGSEGQALIADAGSNGYNVLYNAEELASLDMDRIFHEGKKILGLFASSHMNYEMDRPATEPSLKEMTEVALDYLEEDKEGFFLMVEGARIDHAGHANDGKRIITDTLAFDEAIEVVLKWAELNPKTLVIVTADHECGAMNLVSKGETNDPAGVQKFGAVTKWVKV